MLDKFYSPLLEVMASKWSQEDFCYIVNRFKDVPETDIGRIKDINSCYFFLLAESNLLEEFGSLNPEAVFTYLNHNLERGRRYMKNVVLSNLAECGYASLLEMGQMRLMTMIFIKTFFRERALGTLSSICPF